MALWEIDFQLESDQTRESVWTGRQSITPGTDTRTIAAPAQQAFLYVQDGHLTLPLAGAQVFLDSPRIHAHGSITFQEATGSLTHGLIEQEVQADALVLHGELDLNAHNADGHLTTNLAGSILEGNADGQSVLSTAIPDTTSTSWMWGLLLVLPAYWLQRRARAFRHMRQAQTLAPTQPKQAIQAATRAIKLRPHWGDAHYLRASLWTRTGRLRDALMDREIAQRHLRGKPAQDRNAREAYQASARLGDIEALRYWQEHFTFQTRY